MAERCTAHERAGPTSPAGSGDAMTIRYGAWHGGADPLEPPYDIRQALDEIGDDVLAGMSPRAALNR
ncbi:MAG: hypothetical protein QOE53_2316, partial [Pseudonocardiales bacterium]|nr:hypothetical protein [Pseudonocardiales bacterium]